ncbi:NAD-dependent epimerase/dehydratase family protein [Nisaea sediminum]|uniref:NAD-dependent epimerase/dehydratase family protein n=1 Tax=Nisaea sediminum TaxID=2775867 RepID=UPI0018683943|nr:NAD-dependent epimerase/dehydratase family protein [Nisaea sediminum]
MKIFLTGASGFIGGSVAVHLIAAGHDVRGLVRSQERADAVTRFGIVPVLGSLDDAPVLAEEAARADAVINAASADHRAAVETMLDALAGSGKTFLHTSGSSIVGRRDEGHVSGAVFDEETPIDPSPARAARVALNHDILAAAERNIRTMIIAPSLIYGRGLGVNPDSMQIPWLIDVARKTGGARHIGPGENIWSNVHIGDLVELYRLVLEKAPAGAFYYAENGENSMREAAAAIGQTLGFGGGTEEMSIDEAAGYWGDGPANDTMASNSRVRARRARSELGWAPSNPGLIEEIENGCYAIP